jgi:hypothetical protein
MEKMVQVSLYAGIAWYHGKETSLSEEGGDSRLACSSATLYSAKMAKQTKGQQGTFLLMKSSQATEMLK